jgi:hypothetical protein
MMLIIIIIIENNNIKVQNIFNVRNNITCSTNCKNRATAVLLRIYTRNAVCFRHVIVNTLHEGDKYNNNNNFHLKCILQIWHWPVCKLLSVSVHNTCGGTGL